MGRLKRFALIACASIFALALGGCGGGGSNGGAKSASGRPPRPSSRRISIRRCTRLRPRLRSARQRARAVTQHQIAVNGGALAYTATAGHLTALASRRRAPRKPRSSTSRTRCDEPRSGDAPGDLLLQRRAGIGDGLAAPRLVRPEAPRDRRAVDHRRDAVSAGRQRRELLDVSDLVFVDAVGSGSREAIAPNTNRRSGASTPTRRVFRDFVVRYSRPTTARLRPSSCSASRTARRAARCSRFLLESRACAERRHPAVVGAQLQQQLRRHRATVSCAGYPSVVRRRSARTTTSTLPNPADAELPAFVAQMRTFTTSELRACGRAVPHGGTAPSAALARRSSPTRPGMSAPKWQAHFNMDPDTIQPKLLPGTLIGRYDARVRHPSAARWRARAIRPSTFIRASFAFAIGTYLARAALHESVDVHAAGQRDHDWNFSHDGHALPDNDARPRRGARAESAAEGARGQRYHDLATPFFQTERDLAPPRATAERPVDGLRGGHMTYLDDASRARKGRSRRVLPRAALAP